MRIFPALKGTSMPALQGDTDSGGQETEEEDFGC